MPFSDVVLSCLLTGAACRVGFASVLCFVFLLSVSIFICRLGRFCQKCKYSLRQRIENGVQVVFCGVSGRFKQDIIYTIL